jgi:hypothetical protein
MNLKPKKAFLKFSRQSLAYHIGLIYAKKNHQKAHIHKANTPSPSLATEPLLQRAKTDAAKKN